MAHPKMAEVQQLAVEFLDKVRDLVTTNDLPVFIAFGETTTTQDGKGFWVDAVFSTCTHNDAVERDMVNFIVVGEELVAGRLGSQDAIDNAINAVAKEVEEIGKIVNLESVENNLPKGRN